MKLPSSIRKMASVALLVLAAPCHATNNKVLSCPAQISESSVALAGVAEGWRPYVASPLYLHSAAPIDGPPERLGQLVGKHVRTGPNTWTDTYDLRGPYPEGKWLQCSYGMLNEIVLSRRLEDGITACTIKGKKGNKAGQNVFSVLCR